MHVVGFRVEVGPVRPARVREVPARGVHEPLGLAGRARGVNDEERVLGIEEFSFVHVGLRLDNVVPPHVAASLPGNLLAGAAHHKHVLEVGEIGSGLVGGRLHFKLCAATVLTVSRDEQLRAGVFEAKAHGLGRETTEDERVHGTDAGAGERNDDRLNEHGQVHDDPVAGPNAERGEAVGGLGHAALQVGVGNRLAVARFTLEEKRDLLAVASVNVPVDAVHSDVQPPARKPGRLGYGEPVGALHRR